MSSIADEKKLKRQEFMQRRRNMSAMEHLVLDGSVCARILSLPEFAAADLIIGYISDGNEVEIRGVLEKALELGKKVALPRYDAEQKCYEIIRVNNLQSDLVPGKFGILEPAVDLPAAPPAADDTLWLIPAVAFDENGTRLGRGGGFYDRMLEGAAGVRTGVFYQCQYSSVPLAAAEHDQHLTMAVTEDKIYKFQPVKS